MFFSFPIRLYSPQGCWRDGGGRWLELLRPASTELCQPCHGIIKAKYQRCNGFSHEHLTHDVRSVCSYSNSIETFSKSYSFPFKSIGAAAVTVSKDVESIGRSALVTGQFERFSRVSTVVWDERRLQRTRHDIRTENGLRFHGSRRDPGHAARHAPTGWMYWKLSCQQQLLSSQFRDGTLRLVPHQCLWHSR